MIDFLKLKLNIMEQKKSLILNKLKVKDGLTVDEIREKLGSMPYLETTGIGTIGISNDSDSFEIDILIRTPTYIQDYDQENRVVTKKVVNIYESIAVFLDYDNKLLYSMTPSMKFNKAKSFIRNCFEGDIAFDNIPFSYMSLIKWLADEKCNPCITSMSIRKFKYNEDAIGKFTVKLSSYAVGMKLLEDYGDEVRNVEISAESDILFPFILQCSVQNAISIKSEECDFWKIVELIKRYI